MSAEQIRQNRRQKDRFLESSPSSPLTAEQKARFDGLRYFDYNPDLVFDVTLESVEGKRTTQIMTTTNEIRNYERVGRFSFIVDGEEGQLTIYRTPHGYFLPFVDTSRETYGAGRYLDLEQEPDGSFHIDFNLAYNPFCAYNEHYSCPLTPIENRLNLEIKAGEKVPEGDWTLKA